MEHDARAVARYFLEEAEFRGPTLTSMQVLKLVYIAHGWMLAIHGRPLIRERIEAWRFGPVIPTVYDAVKRFGSGPIDEPIEGPKEPFTLEERHVMNRVYEVYSRLHAFQLSALTHREGTPWHKLWHDEQGREQSYPIPNHLIAEHYRNIAQASHGART